MTRWPHTLAVVAVAVAGCGGATADLSGTVTFRGKPVTSGTVQVLQPGGRVAVADIRPDGRFHVRGAVPGPAGVGVSSPDPRQAGAGGGRGPHTPGPADPTWVRLPARYADPDQSGLTVTLTAGGNALDLTLAD